MSNCPAITDEPLWDRVTVLSTTSPMRLQLFQVPHGNYDPYESYCTQPKGRADTSMYQHGGRLGGNESFTVEAIELSLDDAATYPPGAPDSDVAKLWALAHFELRTENDRALVFSAPLASVRGNKVRWNLKRKIHIDRGEGFGAAINFSRAPSLSRDRKVMCVLYGDHYMVPVHAQGFADGACRPRLLALRRRPPPDHGARRRRGRLPDVLAGRAAEALRGVPRAVRRARRRRARRRAAHVRGVLGAARGR